MYETHIKRQGKCFLSHMKGKGTETRTGYSTIIQTVLVSRVYTNTSPRTGNREVSRDNPDERNSIDKGERGPRRCL